MVQENIRGIRVVKSFVREEHEKTKFNAVSDEIYQNFMKAEKIVAFNSPLMQGTMYLSILAISYIAARLIVSSSMTTGQLMSFITYTSQILMSLMMLSMVIVMLTISKASAQRIEEVLSEQNSLDPNTDGLKTIADGSISFEHVDFSYFNSEEKRCLYDINLRIESGQTVGILGPTGSAKTTLVQLIPRLYDVLSGTVKVGGVDVRRYNRESLRVGGALVRQKTIRGRGTVAAQADSFFRAMANGYVTHIEQDGSNVSGGQKQRLCIARALLKKPKILILDDSTSAVDTKTDAAIRKAMATELKDTTKIIIAQRVASVEDADQIIMLDDGHIQAVGTHQQLLDSCPRYQELHAAQLRKEEQA